MQSRPGVTLAMAESANTHTPLRRSARGPARLTGWALFGALAMLAPGLTLPTLHLVSLGLFSQEYSLLSAIITFWEKQHYSLFALLLAFTVIFPLAKIAGGLWLFYLASPNPQKLKNWISTLSTLSKWSMLDVFIVAVLVLALEGSLITAASLGAGIALFAGSVLLSGWAYGQLMRLLIRRIEEESQ
jgi:paraquat-inducible protein A